MPESCSCCGQEIVNPVWDRDAQYQAEKDLRDRLRGLLGDHWEVTADNALVVRGQDTKLEIVVHALIKVGAHIDGGKHG